MGMTTEDFDKKVTARLIKANDLVPALAKSMKELAAPGIVQAMNQLGVAQNKMTNAWKEFGETLYQEGGIKDSLVAINEIMARLAKNELIKVVFVPFFKLLSAAVTELFGLLDMLDGMIADISRMINRYETLENKLSPAEKKKFFSQNYLNRQNDELLYRQALMRAERTGEPQQVAIKIGVDKDEFEKVFTVTVDDIVKTSWERAGEGISK